MAEATVDNILRILAMAAEHELRKLAEVIERRKLPQDLQVMQNLVETAYPYVIILRNVRTGMELSQDWNEAIDAYWNDFQYMKELTLRLMRK